MLNGLYYRTEVKGIQSFVLRGRRLRDQLGGSALIRRLFEGFSSGQSAKITHPSVLAEVVERVFEEPLGQGPPDATASSVVQLAAAAGGATLLIRDLERAGQFAARWAMEVSRVAPSLHMIQAWCDASRFGEQVYMGELARRLADARNQLMANLPLGNPIVDRPNAGSRAAVYFDRKKGEMLDAVLAAQRREERSFFESTNDSSEDDAREQQNSLRLDFMGPEYASRSDLILPKSVDDIVGRGARHYLAVIQIDGNSVGNLVRGLMPREYSELSSNLKTATLESVRQAAREALVPDRHRDAWLIPGRPIVIGGDDVTVLVRADLALAFVHAFARAFEASTRGKLPGSDETFLTASAGVAFVRASHPFRLAHHLAEALIEHAKRAGRQTTRGSDAPPSLVSFQRTTSSLDPDEPFAERRLWLRPTTSSDAADDPSVDPTLLIDRQRTGCRKPDKSLQLTAGPYGLTPAGDHIGLERISKVARLVLSEDTPRGPFRELARALQDEPAEAEKAWARIREVNRMSGRDALSRALGEIHPELVTRPWFDDGHERLVTPWLDIIHLTAIGADHVAPPVGHCAWEARR